MAQFQWVLELLPLSDEEIRDKKWLDCSKEPKWVMLEHFTEPIEKFAFVMTKNIEGAFQIGRYEDAVNLRSFIQLSDRIVDCKRLTLVRYCFKSGRCAYRACTEEDANESGNKSK